MMAKKHAGVACMAQKHHGDGDVDGPLRKIGNLNVIDVTEYMAC